MRRVPRLSEYYELSALYFFSLGQDAQWFQPGAGRHEGVYALEEWKGPEWDGQLPLDLVQEAA